MASCHQVSESFIQRPTYDTPATAVKQSTAGMLATARIPAVTGMPALGRDTSRRRRNLNSKNASNSRKSYESGRK